MTAATATKLPSTSTTIAATCLVLMASGCTSRPATFASAARALGAAVDGDSCSAGAADLTARTLEAWQKNPHTNPYAANFRCVALDDDLTRDTVTECAPAPSAVFGAKLRLPRRVTGEIIYMGLDPREYAYDLLPRRDGGIDLEVRIQFKGPLIHDAEAMSEMRAKLALAGAFWTTHSPDPQLHFHFVAQTDDTASPHFSITLDPGAPRTPFDETWGRKWPWHLMAHEIGHMMGLDDEYGQIRKTVGHILNTEKAWDADPSVKISWFQCDLTSLMCDSKGAQSVPQPYHYYVILRRRFCHGAPYEYPRFDGT